MENNIIEDNNEMIKDLIYENIDENTIISKYIVFNNSVKSVIKNTDKLLIYPEDTKYGLGDAYRDSTDKIFATQSADIVVIVDNYNQIKIMYVRSNIDKDVCIKYINKINNYLKEK